MSKEEQEAVKKLKDIIKVNNDFLKDIPKITIKQKHIKAIDIILHLIEKQQKEIEELKQENNELDYMTIHLNGFYDGEKKWKDKIREKINKLKKNDIEYSETIAILEKLLEEN